MLLEIFLKYSIIYPSLQKINCNNVFLEKSFPDSFLFIHILQFNCPFSVRAYTL